MGSDLTTHHVRRAAEGEAGSLDWIVARFSPFLLVHARQRLLPRLRDLYDPEDLVQDVWAVALPRLGSLPERGGRLTPVLLKFLGTTLLNRYGNLLQKHIQGKPLRQHGEGASDGIDAMPKDVTGAITHAVRNEQAERVRVAIDQLAPRDREVLVLRGLEQGSPEDVALVIGTSRQDVAVRYHRALKRLRKQLPGTILDEIGDD